MRWAFVVVVVVHGLLHLFGAAKAFALAELPQLTQPIPRSLGVLWFVAAALLLSSAVAFVFAPRWFWILGALGVVASQIAIASNWIDASVGTVANLVVLVVVVHGFLSQGPWSLRTEYRHEATAALARAPVPRLVVEEDLLRLPEPVRAYVRSTGAVGQPQVVDFRAAFRGRIRAGASEPWMDFQAEQVSVYEERTSSRLFFMDATMKHLPLDVLHRFIGDAATFRVRLLSAITMVDAKGPEMNRSETVTLFNDLCLLAPSQLIDPAIAWELVDAHHVRARYTRGDETVLAELVFDASTGDLVDFVSDDRFAASPDGKTFTVRRWRTPARNYRTFGSHRLMSVAEARWEALGGAFTYLEIDVVGIEFNVGRNAGEVALR